jgi:hypothetical protein
MRFDSTSKVIISTLDKPEAIAFIKFLESECIRHEDDIEQARHLIAKVRKMLQEGEIS